MRLIGLTLASVLVGVACASSEPTPAGHHGAGGAAGDGGSSRGGSAGSGGSATPEGGDGGDSGDGGEGNKAGDGGSSGAGEGGQAGTAGSGASGGEGGLDGGAGGEGPIAPRDFPEATSGSRLRARVLVGDDGSRHFVGFRDTTLGMDCDFADVGGGDYRCVPSSNNLHTLGYADDQCSLLGLGARTGCSAAPSYVTTNVQPRPNCDGAQIRTVQSVGARLPGAYQNTGTACEPSADSALFDWYALSAASPATFVGATLDTTPLGGELVVRRFLATDGASQTFSLAFNGSRCTPNSLTNAGTRCTPLPALMTTFFVDDQCTAPIANLFSVGDGCSLPWAGLFRVADPNNACGQLTSVRRLSPYTATGGFRINGAACEAFTLPVVRVVTRAVPGDTVDPDTLPALSPFRVGSTRLRADAVRTANQSTVVSPPHTIYDTTLGITCTPTAFEDGSLRCFAYNQDGFGYVYADSDCRQPLVEGRGCTTAGYTVEATTDPNCASRSLIQRVWRRGAAHTGPVYEQGSQGCTEVVTTEGQTFFQPESVTVDTFVRLTEMLE